ncbi:hypothetical protein [Pseudomonas sp. CLCA07]
MPTENKPAEPGFDLNTPDGGRGYIANLFKTVLNRHDYRQYINERLAGDFACTLAQHFEDVKAREQALQLRLNAAHQRIDELAQRQGEPVAWSYRFGGEQRFYPTDPRGPEAGAAAHYITDVEPLYRHPVEHSTSFPGYRPIPEDRS